MTDDSILPDSARHFLERLRSAQPPATPLPELPVTGPWLTFDNAAERFQAMTEAVGGRCLFVADAAAAEAALEELPAWSRAATRCSLVANIGSSTFDPAAVDDPHELQHTDFAVLPGEFGVAENGAVWVTDEQVPHRALFFLPQHIALVIPAEQIVHNLHEAYDRLRPQDHRFGAFISGPSKTADIEQSLVIGAHGARSLTVLAVQNRF